MVVSLPSFSMIFVSDFLFRKMLSHLPADTEIMVSFLYLLVNIVIIHYFLGKYGSMYKLSIILFMKNDIEQLFKKDPNVYKELLDIHMALTVGFVAYALTIIALLIILIDTPLFLSKIVVGIVVALLLIYVLPNNKYENVVNLIKKIWDER